MNRLNRAQKDKVRRFAAVADASEDVALKVLKDSRWDLEVAFESFFTMPQAHAATTDPALLEAIFTKYKAEGEDEEMVSAEGIMRFCEDIEIDPTSDPVILLISFKMSAQGMGKYTKEEFVGGLRKMGCDTVEKLKQKLSSLRSEMQEETRFKEVYEYSFGFAKEANQKSLPLETACAMWHVLMGDRWPLLDAWCEFLEKEHNKPITHDTWSQALEFSRLIGPDLEGYDPAGAWPYLIDEFVEAQQAKAEEAA